jgi:hypothetical protein
VKTVISKTVTDRFVFNNIISRVRIVFVPKGIFYYMDYKGLKFGRQEACCGEI